MSKPTIAVIDYGMGNLHSVASALKYVSGDAEVQVTSDPKRVLEADKVILPGVGAIRDCMAEIRRLGFASAVASVIDSGRPLLAVCVGLQALMEHSDENGGVPCLHHFPGQVKSFSENPQFRVETDEASHSGEKLKVPHMGWNQVDQLIDHPLWQSIPDRSRFYFVHSYYVRAEDPSVVAGECHYGVEFNAALARDNIFAAQFHPEKSADHGLQLLRNFVSWDGKP